MRYWKCEGDSGEDVETPRVNKSRAQMDTEIEEEAALQSL